ncbi:Methyltransferase domain-containing protein [Candidatus Magnetomoraceae bacterium gMMP-15]
MKSINTTNISGSAVHFKKTCPLCNKLIHPIDILENIKQGWHIKRCPKCKISFVDPQPSDKEIQWYYNGMYSKEASEFNLKKMHWAINSVSGYLKVLLKQQGAIKQTVLDLGGGLGYYSKAFEERGLSVTLVEQDPVSAKFARKILKIKKVREQSLDSFFVNNEEKKYDLIFLRHVIEHSTKPVKLIENISNLLEKGGILIIETDNNAGIELLFRPSTAKFYLDLYHSSYLPSSLLSILIRRPFAVDPPRHLFGFRMSNLSKLCEKHSLIPFKKVHYRLGHPIYWPNLPLPEIGKLLEDFIHLKWLRVVISMADFCLLPVRVLLQIFGMSSGICIYAIKK